MVNRPYPSDRRKEMDEMVTQKRSLRQKALLMRINVGGWSGRKYDKKASAATARVFNADANSGRYNKVLVAEDKLKEIQKIASEARTIFYKRTLAWGDDESRMLPGVDFIDTDEKMREKADEYNSKVSEFLPLYPEMVEDAKAHLNGMWNASDYPTVGELKRKYYFRVSYTPLPDASDFRVDMQEDDLNYIKAELEIRNRESVQQANKELWQRLYDVVSHMAKRWAEDDVKVYDSVIENIIELCALLPKLNIMDDEKLDAMAKEVESRLCGYDTKTIRANKDERKDAAKEAQAVLDAMAGYFGETL
jgi:hypothetical protein